MPHVAAKSLRSGRPDLRFLNAV